MDKNRVMKRCKGKTPKGRRCLRPAMKGLDFCYHHNEKKKKDYTKYTKKGGGAIKAKYEKWQRDLAAVLDDQSYKSQLALIKMGILRATKQKMEKADEYLVIKWIKLRHETLVAMDRAEGVGVDVKLTVVDYAD